MNLAALDLNLLVTLDALVSETHVGRAAKRIGLSQPAASHALNRLRVLIGDPLLVRVGSRMQLTPRAESLRAPLVQALDQVRDLFVSARFDPGKSTRRFVLMMPDHVADLVMPRLLKGIAHEAPEVRLDLTPWRGPASISEDLARSIDLLIACVEDDLAGFDRQPLFSDTEAIAVRRGHPAGRRLARLNAFQDARHVAVVGRGQTEDPVDGWLREEEIERRIALVVPTYLQALHIAAHSDLVAFVPRRLIEALAGSLGLVAVRPPVDPGSYHEFMFHPARARNDPGSLWLRNRILSIGRSLDRSH